MRLTICVAGALVLAGCSEQDETPEAVDTVTANDVVIANESIAASNAAAPSAAAGPVTANGSTPGTFEVTTKSGSKTRLILNADGSYSETGADGQQTESGRWTVTDGKTCFDPEGDKVAACYAESPVGADGTYTATREGADPVTVKKIS